MIIVQPSADIIDDFDGDEVLKKIEVAGRICYKSEDRITDDSARRFVKALIASGHESVLEHFSFSARIVCDRGVSHEIVRHRICSFSQVSTRYVNYGKTGIEVIEPRYLTYGSPAYDLWLGSCESAESTYLAMLHLGCTPQEARAVLPNSLKTEIIMTANLREWRHFFRLRTGHASHPQMREVAEMLLWQAKERIPVVFEDITGETSQGGKKL